MDLSGKLARLGNIAGLGPRSSPPIDHRRETIDRLRRMLDEVTARHAGTSDRRVVARGLEPVQLARRPPPGAVVDTPRGRVHIAEKILPPDHCHGRVPVARALHQNPALLAALALDPSFEPVQLRGLLILDTETTGLSGGTGTIPFLIGLAWFEDQSLVVHQLLLHEPGEEEPMLELLVDRLRSASMLVTYNGKSFDWPLLSTRMILHRVTPPPLPPHLDLLHCVRRIYKRRLREAKLTRIEEAVLGMRRERDIDGFEIPSLYWSFVRDGDGDLLSPVLEHNANDLIALAAILAVLVEGYAEVARQDDPLDHLGRAEVAMRSGDRARAKNFALAAAEGGGEEDTTRAALELAARIALKEADPAAARALLLRALDHTSGDHQHAAVLHLRLAKLYEHRLRDFTAARVHAEHAAAHEGAEASERRLLRLRRKARQSGPTSQMSMIAPAIVTAAATKHTAR